MSRDLTPAEFEAITSDMDCWSCRPVILSGQAVLLCKTDDGFVESVPEFVRKPISGYQINKGLYPPGAAMEIVVYVGGAPVTFAFNLALPEMRDWLQRLSAQSMLVVPFLDAVGGYHFTDRVGLAQESCQEIDDFLVRAAGHNAAIKSAYDFNAVQKALRVSATKEPSEIYFSPEVLFGDS